MARRPTITQVRFRLRDELLQALARAAESNDRSLNDEVERRLEQTFVADQLEAATQKAIVKMREDLQAGQEMLMREMTKITQRAQRRAIQPRRKAKQEKAQ
jgi:hypothetical protein